MSDNTKITVTKNGPYTVSGPITLKDQAGDDWDLPDGKVVALCRCGKSASKPFCDGTHSKDDFESDVTPSNNPYPYA